MNFLPGISSCPQRNWQNWQKSTILSIWKHCKSRSHCPLIHKLLFFPSIPKLSYTRILNSASIAALALGFVVEGKRRSVEPSVVACSCGLAPLCFDGLHLLPSEQPAIQGKKWERKEKHDANFPTLTLFDTHAEQKQTGQQIIVNGNLLPYHFLPQQKNSLQGKTMRVEEGKKAWLKFPNTRKKKVNSYR